MIIKANSRKNGRQLAAYLLTENKQQKAVVLDLRGSLASDLGSVLNMWEKEAMATTKAEKPLYHMQIRLAPGEELNRSQWFQTLDVVEKALQLTDHPRAIVAHSLKGEVHLHIVFSRLDRERGTVLRMAHDRKHMLATCRRMEKEYGLRMLESVPNRQRNGNQKTRSIEHVMAKESRTTRKTLCTVVTAAWNASQTGRQFQEYLKPLGLTMTRGERRDYNVWYEGKRYDPVRLLETIRSAEFSAKMKIDPPRVEPASGKGSSMETRAGVADNAEPPAKIGWHVRKLKAEKLDRDAFAVNTTNSHSKNVPTRNVPDASPPL